MARTLESWPSRPGASRYAWDEILDGRIRELIAGVDFTSKISTFRANAQLQAKKRGGRVRSMTQESDGREALVLQFMRG